MNDIAFFFGDKFIYWNSIITVLAAAATVFCAAGLRLIQKGEPGKFLLFAAAGIPAALLCSRLVYGLFTLENPGEIFSILFSGRGGHSLLGAGIGVLLTAVIAKAVGWTDSIADTLDCLAPASALGLCFGRLSAVFGSGDRGMEIPTEAAGRFITDIAEPDGQPVLAVYAYESIFAGLLFAACLLLFFFRHRHPEGKTAVRSGDTALLFLCGFGASQGVLESMRTDSITVIGLGFVRVLQITSLVCLMIPFAVFSVRAVRKRGVNALCVLFWIAGVGLLALAVYMEFTMAADFEVQLRNYGAMANCMIGMQEITACLYFLSINRTADNSGRKPVPRAKQSVGQSLWQN